MMLSATKAKEILEDAVKVYDAEVRRKVEGEVEIICDDIRDAASRRFTCIKISPDALNNPNGVFNYLRDELGYECSNCHDGRILVRWAPAP